MYFEAELNGKLYKVDVIEKRDAWKISLQEDSLAWELFELSKTDYRYLESAISLLFEGKSYVIDVVGSDTEYTVYTRGSYRSIRIYNDEALLHESLKQRGGLEISPTLSAGMPGKIAQILVKPGDEVKMDEPLLIMEAMKMENEMRAPRDVKIKSIHVKSNESVEVGATLITFY